jgi:hypothetical protein
LPENNKDNMRNLLDDQRYLSLFNAVIKDGNVTVVLTVNSRNFDLYTPPQLELALLLLKLAFLYAARDVRMDFVEWPNEDYISAYRVDVVGYDSGGEIVAMYTTDCRWAFQLADGLKRLPEGEDYPELRSWLHALA